MRKLLAAVLVGGVVAIVPASAASAGPVPAANPHRHFIITPTGEMVEVGASACDNPNAKAGFDHFHAHVHLGTPQDAFANEGNDIVMVSRGCSFVP